MPDEKLLLDLLNTTPVRNGATEDDLADARAGSEWLAARGQPDSEEEWRAVREVRSVLQRIVRGQAAAAAAAPFVEGLAYRAFFEDDEIQWELDPAPGHAVASRVVLAWAALAKAGGNRLRPCANPECRLFLIDHSKPNSARWCSMAVCGNRMKARRHHQRTRESSAG
jgi:predicted RNA-binding Zn ribbon-like protein